VPLTPSGQETEWAYSTPVHPRTHMGLLLVGINLETFRTDTQPQEAKVVRTGGCV